MGDYAPYFENVLLLILEQLLCSICKRSLYLAYCIAGRKSVDSQCLWSLRWAERCDQDRIRSYSYCTTEPDRGVCYTENQTRVGLINIQMSRRIKCELLSSRSTILHILTIANLFSILLEDIEPDHYATGS